MTINIINGVVMQCVTCIIDSYYWTINEDIINEMWILMSQIIIIIIINESIEMIMNDYLLNIIINDIIINEDRRYVCEILKVLLLMTKMCVCNVCGQTNWDSNDENINYYYEWPMTVLFSEWYCLLIIVEIQWQTIRPMKVKTWLILIVCVWKWLLDEDGQCEWQGSNINDIIISINE